MPVYATPADLIERFGAAELVRLTTPEGQDMGAVDTAKVTRAIEEASGVIDSYLRLRYAVPLAAVPVEVRRAACILARYDLAFGENRDPPEQARLARKDVITWLERLADGAVTLAGVVPTGTESQAMSADRTGGFTPAVLARW